MITFEKKTKMANAIFNVPKAINETVKNYVPGSQDHKNLISKYKELYDQTIDIPMYIDGKEIRTDNKIKISPPHDHKHIIGQFNYGESKHVNEAIHAAMNASSMYSLFPPLINNSVGIALINVRKIVDMPWYPVGILVDTERDVAVDLLFFF